MASFEFLPASAGMTYAELLSALLRAPFPARGTSYFTRDVKGRAYWYLQYKIGASMRSQYIGPDNENTRKLVEAARHLVEADADDRVVRERLVATGLAAGLRAPSGGEARVFEALVQAGVFAGGSVLIGSHAFAQLGNLLGVQWQGTHRTADIDVGRDPSIEIAAAPRATDLEARLREADQAFFAVPSLNRKHPATSFKIRGRELSVSLLTPMTGKTDATPVEIPALKAAAEPLRFLDYLLEESQPAAIPVEAGLLINLPDPARFALHKLVVSQRRPAAFAAKSRKDIQQANAVLDVLRELRPGDVHNALQAAGEMGEKFMEQLRLGAGLLDNSNREFLEGHGLH